MIRLFSMGPNRSRSIGLLLGGAFVLTAAHPLRAQEKVRAPEASYQAPAETRGAGPNGATMRCKDGTHPAATAPASACDARGGVLVRYPLLTVPAAPMSGGEETVIPVPRGARGAEGAMAARDGRGGGATAAGRDAGRDAPRRVTRPPADATLLCTDGTYVRADTTSARCGAHGGVRLRFQRRGTS